MGTAAMVKSVGQAMISLALGWSDVEHESQP
jgi:hypothetical protein